MKPVLKIMERIGPSDANVLITGEHGTGKEVVARWLHTASPTWILRVCPEAGMSL